MKATAARILDDAGLARIARPPEADAQAPLDEDAESVTLALAPCGSGGRLECQDLPARHPAACGGWSDGV